MVDMAATVAPKSDQLNYDDLIGGEKIITVTGVRGNATPEQPVSVFFEGDNKKPYKPCKSMRRVMIAAWGPDAAEYVGRSMKLYGDPDVTFGGMKVGGIRISQMTNIERDMMIPLTVTKARRKPYIIKPLDMSSAKQNHKPDVDIMTLKATAYSTAEGGEEVYKGWFVGLSKEIKTVLTTEQDEDPNDFNKPKSIHEICKGIAAAADAQKSEPDKSQDGDDGY